MLIHNFLPEIVAKVKFLRIYVPFKPINLGLWDVIIKLFAEMKM